MIQPQPLSIPCWIIDGKSYQNQFEAWLAIGSGDPSRARFDFYDQEYDQIDFTQEPKETWDNLLKARCIQLRQRYTHLCLLYSGGRDSHHVLRTFAKNQIPIDELIIIDYTLNPFRHREVDPWILPLAYHYKNNHNPMVKITKISVTKKDFELFFNETWSERKLATGMTGQYSPSHNTWLINQHIKTLRSGTGIIQGQDKPYIFLKDGWLHTDFWDQVMSWNLAGDRTFEYFYWAPDLPELHVKQCHMVINWWEKNMPWIDEETIWKFINNPRSGYYDDYCMASGRGPAVNLNFPGQNGHNKYDGSHPTFQIARREAEKNRWRNFFHWQESWKWLKNRIPCAFVSDDPNNRVFKIIRSKSRRLRAWTPKAVIQ